MKSFFFIILFLFIHTELQAEDLGSLISPGKLAKSHEKYDAIKSCTKCHKLGGGVPDQKCLNCHEKLDKLIRNKKSIHARYSDPCIQCHGDHKGRNYKLISLDEKKFDHNQTGYKLEERHGEIACKKCHKKKNTFRGLKADCLSCHKNYHKGRLKKDCLSCHNFRDWKETEKFDHNRDAAYKLTGLHLKVKCKDCHRKNRYKIKHFKRCDSCHKNPHKKEKITKKKLCRECHVTGGWKVVKINHSKTKYPLTGKHKKVACGKCHKKKKITGIPFDTCNSSYCHKNPHGKQFKGQKCDDCHTTRRWSPSLFRHGSSYYKGFKLKGRHRKTSCEKCHKKGRYRGLKYGSCVTSDCHRDPHRKQFKGQKCTNCHSEKRWKPSHFDHNSKRYKGFKLEGKHLKTKCNRCHFKGKYRKTSSRCYSCHKKDDIHKKALGKTCGKCHNAADWKKSFFDHNKQSEFPLIGKHKTVKCKKCHKNKRYQSKKKKCAHCHKDIHKGEFKGACNVCHTQYDWQPKKYPHGDKTGFFLKGVHRDLICIDCHKTKGSFKNLRRECSRCHEDPHFNQFGRLSCSECHGEFTWAPTAFNHSKTIYPLMGNHRLAECDSCHSNGLYKATTRRCISCHESQYMAAPNHLSDGYSQDCTHCHFVNFIGWGFRHEPVSTGCSSCHINSSNPPKPADHNANNWVTCEDCHKSTALWTFTHSSKGGGCSLCHLDYSTPPKPESHRINNLTVCEDCHQSTATWASAHPSVSGGCSSCHLNSSTPPKPASHSINNLTTCEDCHQSTLTWATTHQSVSTGCSACHLGYSNPPITAKHTTYNWVSCENCHQSTALWTFTHPAAATGCSLCHLDYSTPPKPASHSINNLTLCEDCHQSTATWASAHPSVSGGCSSCHLNSSTPPKPASHSINNLTTCEDCHLSTLTWTTAHQSVSTGCSACHLGYSNPPRTAKHTSQNWVTCEECHKSTTLWTFAHPAAGTGCSTCHLDYSNPPKTAKHTSHNWVTCEECHK